MGSLKSYPFAVHSLHFSQDSVSFCFPCYRFKSEQLSEGATNGRPQEEKKGSWEMGRRTRLLLQLVMVLKER